MRTFWTLLAAVLFIAAVVALALRSERTLTAALPPAVACASAPAALTEAEAYVRAHGGTVVAVLGTGSMAPYIPASAPGRDPMTTVVALAVTDPHATFASIAPGSLCLYTPAWAPPPCVIHLAAAQDSAGWIMTGLHNTTYEKTTRVTAQNFRGLVVRVYTWPQ